MKKNTKITVLGGGLWGTVLAHHLGQGGKGREVRLWEFFPELAAGLHKHRSHPHIPGLRLHEGVRVTSDLAKAAEAADVLLFVLPSGFVRKTARALKEAFPGLQASVVSASKGLEPKTLLTMGEVIGSELKGAGGIYALSGPSFAREVARGVPTRMVLAGPKGTQAEKLRRLFNGGSLRVETSQDRKGVELGGSLKNAVAIGCGVLDGLKAGANTKAALIVQGMAEIAALIKACGGTAQTIYGPAGLGDLVLTGTSSESRNWTFGEKLGGGKTPEQARREIATVVEGIDAAESGAALARRRKVAAPLIGAIGSVTRGTKPPRAVLQALGFN